MRKQSPDYRGWREAAPTIDLITDPSVEHRSRKKFK